MDKELIINLYKEYQDKIDTILKKYGEKDGFIINGDYWWDYYKKLIDEILEKIRNNKLTEDDATNFYRNFGFGPKLYGRSFIENGLDRIENLFLFLTNSDITPSQKIRELVEEPESENFIKGVGINFITLFLTTYFPNEYVQWNVQTDGALKILNLFPEKKRGEKRSDFYLKVNDICKKISDIIDLKSLPKLDNFLYCLNRGYIGSEKLVEIKYEKEAKEIEERIEEKELPEGENKHLEMMYYIIKIGLNKGYDVWIAVNDRNKEFKVEKFSNICLQKIPKFTQPSTLAIAKFIDVIWFKKNTSHPIRFFEIEHSTSIYSGLLRLNDVKIDYPISKATIVIPKDRVDKFEREIKRRTFIYTELADVCEYLSYNDLKKWYKAVSVDSKYA